MRVIARVEDRLVVVSQPTGVAVYDFPFEPGFRCSHPHVFEREERCVLRIGAVADYAQRFDDLLGWGLRLVNSPAEHELASELEHWYPVLHDLTPRTEVFDTLPPAEQVEARFGWPVFLKGSRQTSRHNAGLSVIGSAAEYRHAAGLWAKDPVMLRFRRARFGTRSCSGKRHPPMPVRWHEGELRTERVRHEAQRTKPQIGWSWWGADVRHGAEFKVLQYNVVSVWAVWLRSIVGIR